VTSIGKKEFMIEIIDEHQVVVDDTPYAVDFDSVSGQPVYSLLLDGQSYESYVYPSEDGWQVLLPMYDRIQKVVASMYAPPSSSEEGAASEAARVQIWNGTGLPQRELIAADLLGWRGVSVVETGPADQPSYAETRIVVFQDKPTTVALLIRELGVKEQNVVYEPDPDQGVDIRVILGSDYNPCR